MTLVRSILMHSNTQKIFKQLKKHLFVLNKVETACNELMIK